MAALWQHGSGDEALSRRRRSKAGSVQLYLIIKTGCASHCHKGPQGWGSKSMGQRDFQLSRTETGQRLSSVREHTDSCRDLRLLAARSFF